MLVVALLCPAVGQEIRFDQLTKGVVLSRLREALKDNRQRAGNLEKLLDEAGCTGKLAEQPVKHLKAPNVVCTWPGATDRRILVSAHTDHVQLGDGTVDDWSGASMLADLLESLRATPRRHTFVFIGFAGEEEGLVGSRFYVNALTPAERDEISALVNIECLGLSPTAVWLSHADGQLMRVAETAAAKSKVRLRAINVDQVGLDDAMVFRDRRVPTITFHSVTQQTLGILHSRRDTYRAINPDEYYDSYRFLATYLACADGALQ